MLAPTVAVILAALLAVLALFQIALAAGAPVGRLAWGGADAVLPPRKRVASVVTVVLYAVIAVVALLRAGVVGDAATAVPVVVGMWVVVGVLAVSAVLNMLSRSRIERYVMAPAALVLGILALVIALGR